MTLVQSIYGILRGPAVPMQFVHTYLVHTDALSMTLAGTFELRFEISTSLDRQRVTLPLSLFTHNHPLRRSAVARFLHTSIIVHSSNDEKHECLK